MITQNFMFDALDNELEHKQDLAMMEDELDSLKCIKCHRFVNESDANNLQCPFCGGNLS